jgi:hypothetical protein
MFTPYTNRREPRGATAARAVATHAKGTTRRSAKNDPDVVRISRKIARLLAVTPNAVRLLEELIDDLIDKE